MRSVLTVSLPSQGVHSLQRKVKQRGFASVSEYIRFLVAADIDEDRVTRDEFMEFARRAERDYVSGKLKSSRSLHDVLSRT